MREISEATGEPMLSVLMPTSPMPMTGFTVTIKKSEAIDLNLTVDEAIQFIVSCGVVVPPQQRVDRALEAVARQGAVKGSVKGANLPAGSVVPPTGTNPDDQDGSSDQNAPATYTP